MALAPCLSITQEIIRATVTLGGTVLARTPFVNSFNVSKSRGALSDSFSVVVEVRAGTSFGLGGLLTISAGTRGNEKNIYTGIVEQASTKPAFGKPGYFSLSLAGRGILSKLENKKFSRRLRSDGQGMFCLIKQGPNNRPAAGYSLDRVVESGNRVVTHPTLTPSQTGTGEHSPLVTYNSPQNQASVGGLVGRLATPPAGGGESTEGLGDHPHTKIGVGGPAFGVYSTGD